MRTVYARREEMQAFPGESSADRTANVRDVPRESEYAGPHDANMIRSAEPQPRTADSVFAEFEGIEKSMP
jgi:hypothetical protein